MISLGSGLLDLFVRDTANALWRRHYDGTWHAWESLGGSLASDPAVASWQAGRLDVFARGAADNALWHIWFDGNWHAWESLGGSILAGPAATSWGPNRLDVFVRGADSALWHIGWDVLLWGGWESLGGSCLADSAATSWGPDRLDVFTLGPDATLQHIWFDGSRGRRCVDHENARRHESSQILRMGLCMKQAFLALGWRNACFMHHWKKQKKR